MSWIPSLQIALTWADNRVGFIYSASLHQEFLISSLPRPVIGRWEANKTIPTEQSPVIRLTCFQRDRDALIRRHSVCPRVTATIIDLQVFRVWSAGTDRCTPGKTLPLIFPPPHVTMTSVCVNIVCNNRLHCTGIVPHALVIIEKETTPALAIMPRS